ncbi:MAG: hypothetical protein QM831_12700 [Kofleriaceae bacterium]
MLCALGFGCHHDAPSASTTPQTASAGSDDDGPDVDPTMPSWAPRSCKGYHAAVVVMANCKDVDQAARDAIAQKYDADNKAWHDMTNATQADIDQVGVSCRDSRKSVRDQMAGKCSNVQPVSSLE